ncbi:ABC transporter substrate-binding protein [Pelagicoccus albus]|uniref:ABC transporter substrate-binding protein n=1 Tax=Pelagicoccus albus TaxID=415222 RepID=A0A7X1EA71_9BACT|nr:ABC transporter substrate-binding protein [Pelagicoccus albus]MBC2607953.1 ABC transporter substrate-binding protein [Pelagicoccus albus]
MMKHWVYPLFAFSALLCLAGCGEKESEDGAKKVRFQMGWYAQPERGGFFQGVVAGHFANEGLEVTLKNGGPQNTAGAMLAAGEADIADLRLEESLALIEKGFPIVLVAAYMQHDPQAIMVRESSPVMTMADLDGRRVMARPGIPFLEVIKKKFDIDFSLIPLSGNAALFLSDPEIAQQCFITNEPFYADREGIKVRTMTLSSIGFDLFRVIGVRKSYAEKNPEIVKGFLRGMIAGWEDYLTAEDVTAAHDMIKQMNPTLDEAGMDFAREVMIREKLIEGKENPHGIGWLDVARLDEVMNELYEIGFLKKKIDIEASTDLSFLESL